MFHQLDLQDLVPLKIHLILITHQAGCSLILVVESKTSFSFNGSMKLVLAVKPLLRLHVSCVR